MRSVLARIQQLVREGAVRYTEKARSEMRQDGLLESDVEESILNARWIFKTIRSRSPARRHAHERLYIIKSCDDHGTLIYTKGTIATEGGEEVLYVLISAKLPT